MSPCHMMVVALLLCVGIIGTHAQDFKCSVDEFKACEDTGVYMLASANCIDARCVCVCVLPSSLIPSPLCYSPLSSSIFPYNPVVSPLSLTPFLSLSLSLSRKVCVYHQQLRGHTGSDGQSTCSQNVRMCV